MGSSVFWAGDTGVGFMPRPRGGEELKKDMDALKASGVTMLVSMLTPNEVRTMGLNDEAMAAEAAGLEFVSLPITDHSIPNDSDVTFETIKEVAAHHADGGKIVTHCFAGIGRSSTIAACLLIEAGYSADEALEMLSAARGFRVPETREQNNWVYAYEKHKKDE